MQTTLGFDSGGFYLEVFTDDDGGSGYGANPRVGRWYGTPDECAAVDPSRVKLYPMVPASGVDPFDLACERRAEG